MCVECPEVSIIVPVYNLELYIEKCIKSILAQTFTNYELIIVNDGSTDTTYEICKKYAALDKRIKLIMQENLGVVMARRNGIELASGKYVTFIDGDDWVEPEMLQTMVSGMADSDMVCCGAVWEEKKGNITKKRDSFAAGMWSGMRLEELKAKVLFDKKSGISQLLTAWLWAKMYDLKKIKEEERKTDNGIYVYEDALLVYRYVLGCNRITFLDLYPYHYSFRNESASHSIDKGALANINNVYKGMLKIAEDYRDLYCFKEQADSWLLEKCYFILNERMGLETDGRVIRYLFDCSELMDKRIVLYGAGRAGEDIYAQLKSYGIEVTLWVDKRANEICDDRIFDVSKMMNIDFDIVLIAIENNKIAGEVKKQLIKYDIPMNKISIAKMRKIF